MWRRDGKHQRWCVEAPVSWQTFGTSKSRLEGAEEPEVTSCPLVSSERGTEWGWGHTVQCTGWVAAVLSPGPHLGRAGRRGGGRPALAAACGHGAGCPTPPLRGQRGRERPGWHLWDTGTQVNQGE